MDYRPPQIGISGARPKTRRPGVKLPYCGDCEFKRNVLKSSFSSQPTGRICLRRGVIWVGVFRPRETASGRRGRSVGAVLFASVHVFFSSPLYRRCEISPMRPPQCCARDIFWGIDSLLLGGGRKPGRSWLSFSFPPVVLVGGSSAVSASDAAVFCLRQGREWDFFAVAGSAHCSGTIPMGIFPGQVVLRGIP